MERPAGRGGGADWRGTGGAAPAAGEVLHSLRPPLEHLGVCYAVSSGILIGFLCWRGAEQGRPGGRSGGRWQNGAERVLLASCPVELRPERSQLMPRRDPAWIAWGPHWSLWLQPPGRQHCRRFTHPVPMMGDMVEDRSRYRAQDDRWPQVPALRPPSDRFQSVAVEGRTGEGGWVAGSTRGGGGASPWTPPLSPWLMASRSESCSSPCLIAHCPAQVLFNRVAREWRCKWSDDNNDASLVAAQKVSSSGLDLVCLSLPPSLPPPGGREGGREGERVGDRPPFSLSLSLSPSLSLSLSLCECVCV